MDHILLWSLVILIAGAFAATAIIASISSARESREEGSVEFSADEGARMFEERK